jgi:hypothetical protein
MEIQKVFSNIEDPEENLYSVLMSEDEIALFSEYMPQLTRYDRSDRLKQMKDADVLAEKKRSNMGTYVKTAKTTGVGAVLGSGIGAVAGAMMGRKKGNILGGIKAGAKTGAFLVLVLEPSGALRLLIKSENKIVLSIVVLEKPNVKQ